MKYLKRLRTITDQQWKKKKKWVPYDLVALRDALGMGRDELAEAMLLRHTNTQYWELKGSVPRHMMKIIKKLEREARE